MSAKIRTATIGAGHFGRYHAEKYASLPSSQLIAVCDVDRERAEQTAKEHGVRAVSDYRELFGAVDAVSVVVPTKAHCETAIAFLENGVHVLVEKPIAETLEAADAMIHTARTMGLVLQVGHLERFSSVRQAIERVVRRPVYIEANRITPYRFRGTDVSIVLDLMIHDIDMILSLVDAPVMTVDAVGAPVISRVEDIANARIHFANGCVASITASRISNKNERKMRIFQPNTYVNVDFLERKVLIARKLAGESPLGLPNIRIEEEEFVEGDSLKAEVEAFLSCVESGAPPLVGGEEGRRALASAMMIRDSLEKHLRFVEEEMGTDLTG